MYTPYGQAQSPFNIWQQRFQQPQQAMPQLATPQVLQPMPQQAPAATAGVTPGMTPNGPAIPPTPQAIPHSQNAWTRQTVQPWGPSAWPQPQNSGGVPWIAQAMARFGQLPAPVLERFGLPTAPDQDVGTFVRNPWNWFNREPSQAPAAPAAQPMPQNTSFSMAPAPTNTMPSPFVVQKPAAFARGGLACKCGD